MSQFDRDDTLIQLLCCPLKGDSQSINDYPIVEGIPWLIANPQESLVYWQSSFHKTIEDLKGQAQGLRLQAEATSNLSNTTKRLRKLAQAKYEQVNLLEKLLPSFKEKGPTNGLTLTETLYPQQSLASYVDNIHRDWAWGEEENLTSLNCLKEVLKDCDLTQKNVLVLGAGAGRLAYDFHREFKPQKTILTDINPLLLVCAKKVIEGDKVKLYDFPIAPKDMNSVQVLNKLKADAKEEGFDFIFADALKLPFKEESIDMVITPWLIDILPSDPEQLMRSINHCLRPEGLWLNFGPLGFTHQETRFHYTIEEIKEALESSRFNLQGEHHQEIPYMKNPHSQHGRVEKITCFLASKKESVPDKQVQEILPEWLLNTKVPVPKEAHFENLLATHKVSTSVFSEVNGGNSLEEIAKNLAPQFGLEEVETLESLKRFFKRNLP